MNKKPRIFAILLLMILGVLIFNSYTPAQAQAGTPSAMAAEINALRAANGLPPLSVNNYLTMSAQNHADWIAETGQGGHIGINGTYAIDRARAVGYGEGAQIWVTENWARGPGLTVSDCIYVMWDDPAHMDNMLTEWHNEFGVGVALDGQGFTVYVVNFGHTSGYAAPQPTAGPSSTPGGEDVIENTPQPYVQPVMTAEPGADGSVVHVVQYGQTLWAISEAYGIALADLLTLNGMTEDSAIYPEEELLIVPPDETAEEASAEPELIETTDAVAEVPGLTATPTLSVDFPQSAQAQETAASEPVVETEDASPDMTETAPAPTRNFFATIFSGDTLFVGIGLVVVSVFGLVLLLFTSARLR